MKMKFVPMTSIRIFIESFGLPSLKVKPEQASECKIRDGPYGIPNPFVEGLSAAKPKLRVSHPLEASERNYYLNEEKMNMAMLRNIQGLHAPLKLIGRLPFLPSSNLQHEVLTGRDLDIGFEDILNIPDMCETAGQPHAVVERTLGLL
ncbi:Proteasome maturation protein [Papilio xuthus]|uniref:Proteasome maturation protein n=1 Tax=Papilio xuthus TaxID=66420 RepID=A0A194QEP4_PAPXU|nr:Proteasome maturation protein [Papilio xuthus]